MRGFQKENLRLFCITLVSLKKNLFDFLFWSVWFLLSLDIWTVSHNVENQALSGLGLLPWPPAWRVYHCYHHRYWPDPHLQKQGQECGWEQDFIESMSAFFVWSPTKEYGTRYQVLSPSGLIINMCHGNMVQDNMISNVEPFCLWTWTMATLHRSEHSLLSCSRLGVKQSVNLMNNSFPINRTFNITCLMMLDFRIVHSPRWFVSQVQ